MQLSLEGADLTAGWQMTIRFKGVRAPTTQILQVKATTNHMWADVTVTLVDPAGDAEGPCDPKCDSKRRLDVTGRS